VIELKPELASSLDTEEGLLGALQSAIELEHSTIPAYLYALYSLDGSDNVGIGAILRSVVMEEMSHMALACNILNALGGEPVIDKPGFIPTYPGPLPGAVEKGLEVPLAPFSLDLLRKVFMQIEEPEDPLEFPTAAAADKRLTIGGFYTAIRERLPSASYPGDRKRQVTGMSDVIEVVDSKTAIEAVDMIIEQGEGTSQSPLEGLESQEMAHYYRFAEISHGKQLIHNPDAGPETPPDQRYMYGGEEIPFDATGVRPALENPTPASYPAGSKAIGLSEAFDRAYTSLLESLHSTFNGTPEDLGTAVGLMFQCKNLARELMETELPGGKCAGPSFQYRAPEAKA
jgi:rubrerythrin